MVPRFSISIGLMCSGLDVAFNVAHSMGHLGQLGHLGGVGTDHLLLGMASVPTTSVSRALGSVGVTAEGLQEKLAQLREHLEEVTKRCGNILHR